ncbi:MAG: hypothetical protein KKB20_18105 [Proteobacteria bacterium]|nr:hypothetical protein [Pseudomonadota bacterium]
MIAPTALLFPYTEMSPVRLTRALSHFRQIILYRPFQDHPDDPAFRAAEKGWIQFQEGGFIADPSDLAAVVRDFRQWAEAYRSPRDLVMFRRYLQGRDQESSGARLVSDIRGRWVDPAGGRDPEREAQVFLYFAALLDRQRSEINDILNEVDRNETELGRLMGVDDVEPDWAAEGLEKTFSGPPLGPPDDAGLDLIPERLAAWGRFYQAFGPDGPPLFTDRPKVVAELDLGLARRIKTPDLRPGRTTEVLEPVVSLELGVPDRAVTWDELADRRRERPGWFDFVQNLSARAWPAEELDALRRQARELVEKTASGPEAGEATAILTLYLMPGEDIRQSYLAAAGLDPSPLPIDRFIGPIFELRVSGR